MASKRLWTDDGRVLTEEGQRVNREIAKSVKEIVEDYANRGYNLREIEGLMVYAAHMAVSLAYLESAVKVKDE